MSILVQLWLYSFGLAVLDGGWQEGFAGRKQGQGRNRVNLQRGVIRF